MSETLIKTYKTLSTCEEIVMKVIWDFGEPITCMEVMRILKDRYGIVYKDTTVYTFLKILKEKGFITSYKKGVTYHKPIKEEKEYKQEILTDFVNLWYSGNKEKLMKDLKEL